MRGLKDRELKELLGLLARVALLLLAAVVLPAAVRLRVALVLLRAYRRNSDLYEWHSCHSSSKTRPARRKMRAMHPAPRASATSLKRR